jgi:hypothetical protein
MPMRTSNLRQSEVLRIRPAAGQRFWEHVAGSKEIELQRLEKLAHWLDTAFRVPGVGIRFGFDALLDLIPGVGDAIGTILSLYIFQAARRFGVPRVTLVRMALNIAIDFLVGLPPFIGPLFDTYWKANIWNVDLIKRHQTTNPQTSRRAKQRDALFVAVVISFLLLLMAGTIVLTVWIGSLLLQLLR